MKTVSATASERLARRVWITASAPIFVLAALLAVLAAASRVDFARREDQAYRAMTQRLVGSAVGARAHAVAALAHDYANWTDAYDNISRRWDRTWIENNYYTTAADVMIVFRSGQLRYLWTAEHLSESRGAVGRDAMVAARTIVNVSNQAHGASASGMMLMGEDLALVAITPITPEEEPGRAALLANGGPLDYLLVVDTLDAGDVESLGESLGLGDLRFVANPSSAEQGPASWSISLANSERAGALVWRDERPGAKRLQERIWTAILVIFGAALCAASAAYLLTKRLLRDETTAAAKE